MKLCKNCDKKFIEQGMFLTSKNMCPLCKEKLDFYIQERDRRNEDYGQTQN